MTDFSGDNLSAPNGVPTTKSPPPFPPRADERPAMSREPAPAAPNPAVASSGPSLASTAPAAPAASSGQGLQHGAQGGPAGQAGQGGQGNGGGRFPAEVKGRIDVADEVVEKVAALAAIEVEGVADLGGDFERALESVRERIGIGQRRGDQGVKARITGREVAVDVTIMIEYGHVVMDVARAVKNNVAAQTNRMLGLTVVEVNVTVDDVRMPQPPKQDDRRDDADERGEGAGY